MVKERIDEESHENQIAKENKIEMQNEIIYAKGKPLKLKDKTRIHTIRKIDERNYSKIVISFAFHKEIEPNEIIIYRNLDESIDKIESYLEDCKSIFQINMLNLKAK